MAKTIPNKSVWATNYKDASRPSHAHPGDVGAKRQYGRGNKLPTTNMSGEAVDTEPEEVVEPPRVPQKQTKKKVRIVDRINPWRS